MSEQQSHQHDSTCPACDIGPFTRNHYFTGKLMRAVDFDVEQRFGVDKLRHHLQRLHGWGVVCGLKVKQHPNPACRARFFCVEPGTAVDCCGQDILVREEDCIDLSQLSAIRELAASNDTQVHTLQLCIRYRDCPTEEVPVLFDDCGCDDTRCAPNRILESYELDAIVGPGPTPDPLELPGLGWSSTASPGGARAVALFAGPPAMLYAVSKDQKTVFQIETEHESVIGTAPLPAPGLTLAVSADGTRVYVVTEAVTAGGVRKLAVFDTSSGLSGAPVRTLDIPSSVSGDIFLAVAPDKRLLVLVGSTGDVTIWPTKLDGATPASLSPDSTVSLGPGLAGLAIGSDGKHAYAADATNNAVAVIDLASGTGSAAGTAIKVLPTGFNPTGLTVVTSTGPDLIALVSKSPPAIALVAPSPAGMVGTVTLPKPPVALAISPGGKWAYVVTQDGSKDSFAQAVDLARMQLKLPVTLGTPLPVGMDSRQIVISPTGRTLYIPFLDAGTAQRPGGVAVIDVKESDCEDILWRSIEGCPACDKANCVVLATIAGYRVGHSLLDPTDPPSKPADDDTAKVARIDNHTGRRLLPSTQTLYELIECLEAHATGGAGVQGPPGPPGANGQDGKNGKDGKNGTNGLNGINGVDGAKGDPGPGLMTDLVVITRLSWKHNEGNNQLAVIKRLSGRNDRGFAIVFSDAMKVVDTTISPGAGLKNLPPHPEQVFEVLVREGKTNQDDPLSRLMKPCLCPIRGRVIPVEPGSPANSFNEVAATPSSALAFVIDRSDRVDLDEFFSQHSEVWVRLRGDFVVDMRSPPRALDAAFLRADLSTGERPRGTRLGLEGGLFESWFWIGEAP